MADSAIMLHQQHPPSPIVSFAKWLRKHKTTFILVAVLTVFSSFIVRDALREEYKDMSDSLARAEDNYEATMNTAALRGDLFSVHDQIRDVNNAIESKLTAIKDAVTNTHTTHDKRGDYILLMNRMMGNFQTGISRDRLDVRSSWNLISGLPDSSDKAKLAGDMTALKLQMHMFLNEAMNIAQQPIRDTLPWEALKKLDDSYIEILTKTNEFVQAANSLAADRKETYEKRYRRCTHANYVLYTTILMFALIGKMIGVDIIS
jgi:hypothetical protein